MQLQCSYNANYSNSSSNEEYLVLENIFQNTNAFILKSDKGNFMIIVVRDINIKHMGENNNSNQTKYEKVNLKSGNS